ncbi:MAG: hypothetical protein LBC74_07810 [Planctomycetaceae bacterium]|nr:hypothetical protein [Planctomycetaceae bacterium]
MIQKLFRKNCRICFDHSRLSTHRRIIHLPPSEGLGVVSEELKAVFCCVDVFLG